MQTLRPNDHFIFEVCKFKAFPSDEAPLPTACESLSGVEIPLSEPEALARLDQNFRSALARELDHAGQFHFGLILDALMLESLISFNTINYLEKFPRVPASVINTFGAVAIGGMVFSTYKLAKFLRHDPSLIRTWRGDGSVEAQMQLVPASGTEPTPYVVPAPVFRAILDAIAGSVDRA